MKQQFKDYKAMTADEQLTYIAQLTEFDQQLPRLEQIEGAWSPGDRRDMETGLALIGAFPFARDFVTKALRYGDYKARVRRMRIYIDKVKDEVARGVAVTSADGKQYAYVPQMQQQYRRRGRPTLAEQAQQRQIITNAEQADSETRRQTAIARLLGIEVVVGQQLREKSNDELREERERRKAAEAERNPQLFAAAQPQPTGQTRQEQKPEQPQTEQAAVVPTAVNLPTMTLGDEREYRLHLDQKAPFMTKELQGQVANVRTLRGQLADASNTAKVLAEQGKPKEEIAPYCQQATEANDALGKIYEAIDTEMAVTYYRLLNDDTFRQRFLDRYKFKTMENVSKDLLYDLKKHYQKVQSPEFDLRCKTLIEQESPGYMERVKAEADRKKEVQDILRYLKRKDKDATDARLNTAREKFVRLEELLGKKEAKDYRPLLTLIEDENKKLNAAKETENQPSK